MKTVVVGAGIFGVTASLALRRRGHDVTLVDPGPIPHPLAESTDISKVVRLDYGADEDYTALMERALDGWRRWNEAWGAPLFHETGVLFVSRAPMEPGGFEHDSHAVLVRRGHRLERVDSDAIRRRFPAWNADRYVDGYFNASGGWAASGSVVARLARDAEDAGVRLAPGVAAERLIEDGARVSGIIARDGTRLEGDRVVVTAGSWTPHLLPWLAPHLRSVGQPVFHLAPQDVARFDASCFPVFGADIARTGWYGFPSNGGLVKVANHGVGRGMHPESETRNVDATEHEALRAFLRDTFPSLEGARVAATRVCVYCDTWDQHFWIAPDPDRTGLVVAAGGSGHAFKFAPLVGDIIADAAAGAVVPRFRWRAGEPPATGQERARRKS